MDVASRLRGKPDDLRQTEEAGWSGRDAFLIVVSASVSLPGLLRRSLQTIRGFEQERVWSVHQPIAGITKGRLVVSADRGVSGG